MKIGILTQPLHGNYGGLLQNYALQIVLKEMGHEVETINRYRKHPGNFIKDFVKLALQHIKKEYGECYLSEKQKRYISRFQRAFIEQHIQCTRPLYTQEEFDEAIRKCPYDAYIVGSDQCWRPCYSPNIRNYYLDFVQSSGIKKIAYAASFGVSQWEYRNDMAAEIRNLAKRFDAVSVREKSGVDLCKEHLGIDAAWVLDPTMLLGSKGFERFIRQQNGDDYILTYLLESSPEANALAKQLSISTGRQKIVSNLAFPVLKRGDSLELHTHLPVEKWLNNIYHAAGVITDSFHGAVFSLLFNRPFMVKLNHVRGNTRLESLLEDFGLETCICTDVAHAQFPSFDWDRINCHLASRRKESMAFLRKALES